MSDDVVDLTQAEDVRLAAQTDEGAQLLRPLTGEADASSSSPAGRGPTATTR